MDVMAPHTSVTSMTLRDHVDQLIRSAEKPMAVSDLKKLLKQRSVPIGGKKGYKDIDIERTVNDAVAEGAAHPYPTTTANGKPKYWHTAYLPPPSPAELVAKTVREKVLALGVDDLASDKQIGKPSGKKVTPEATQAFDDTLNELLASGQLHRHGVKFGKKKPVSVAELIGTAVREKVAALVDDEVVAEGKLGKPIGKKATEESTKAFDDTIAQLVNAGTLHKHPGGKYGKTPPAPPPKWYEKAPHKAKFTSLVKAANTLLQLGGVSADELLATLRPRLGEAAPPVTEKPKPPVPPTPVSPPPGAPVGDLRAVLKQAYDHLCLFVEFRDKLVELPRLYHETVKRSPGLTVEAFHRVLWELSDERRIQLHVLNEVREAKEPALAIHRNDRLYYFVLWN